VFPDLRQRRIFAAISTFLFHTPALASARVQVYEAGISEWVQSVWGKATGHWIINSCRENLAFLRKKK